MNKKIMEDMLVSLISDGDKYDGIRMINIYLKENGRTFIIEENDTIYYSDGQVEIYKDNNIIYKVPYSNISYIKIY